MDTGSANFNQKKLLTAILILIPIAFFLRLNSYQLLFEEPRRALVALEMLIADNWLIPTTNGELYYNKPPFYNWILIAFFKLFGEAEWVVRLPSILSLFATGILHYYYSKNYIGKQAALLSSLFYITSADIMFYFSLLGEIDLFYALVVYLQAMLIFHFYQKRQIHWLYLISYALTAVGVLTKGIPSLFFQAITLLVIFILNKDYRRLFSIWHFAGICLLALSAGLYFYLYSGEQEVERYLARLFTETFSRTGIERGWNDSLMHLINFPVMVIKIAAPWCLLFFLTIRWEWKKNLQAHPFLRFCLWFCIANGLLYLLSPGTRERYLYMFFPFVFSILGAALISSGNKQQVWIKRFYLFVGICVSLGLTGMGIFGIINSNLLTGSACLVLAIAVIICLIRWRTNSSMGWILAAIALFLMGRIGFDLVILPTKKQHDTYREDARKMADIIGAESVYLSGVPDHKTDSVKFAGQHFTVYERDEPTYLAFQTSYYLSAFSGKILHYTDKTDQEGFYISKEDFIDTSRVKVYFRFNNRHGKEDQWYVLYKEN